MNNKVSWAILGKAWIPRQNAWRAGRLRHAGMTSVGEADFVKLLLGNSINCYTY
jgi:hypothetical protein